LVYVHDITFLTGIQKTCTKISINRVGAVSATTIPSRHFERNCSHVS